MVKLIQYMINKHRKWDVPLIFLLLSFLGVIYLWHFGYVYYNGDFIYHWGRINAVRNNLIAGKFPLLSIGGTVPYGITLSYYPWITLLPLVLLSFIIHNTVNLFYISVLLITFTTYLVSYYSSHVVNKKWFNNFIFAIMYTNSSVLFNFSFREGDTGATLAMAFIPLAFFGLLNLMKNHKGWLMLSVGVSLIMCSHIITGAFTTLGLVMIALLNIKKFKWSDIGKVILALILFLGITSIFWYPDFIISTHNNLVMPNTPKSIASGIFIYSGSSCNFLYGIPDIVGLLSIIMIKSKPYHWLDFDCWLFGLACLLINVNAIASTLTKYIPYLLHIQMTYRFGLIGHIFLVYLATKWLLGRYCTKRYYQLPLLIIIVLLLFTPLTDQITYHFLMHQRPVLSYQLINKINKDNELIRQGKKKNTKQHGLDSQYKFNNNSFNQFRHYFYCYDYAPNKKVEMTEEADENYRAQIFNNKNKWIGTVSYTPTNKTIEFKNNKEIKNIQIPIVIYKGLKYTFTDDGKKINNNRLNKKMINKTGELVLKNVPNGVNKIEISRVQVDKI